MSRARDQFLMKLRPEFKASRSNLMNHDPSPSLDMCSGSYFVKSNILLHRLTSSKINYPLMASMLLKWKGKVKTCEKFNAIAARNKDILLPIVWRSIVIIASSLDILSKIALPLLGVVRLMSIRLKLVLHLPLLVIHLFLLLRWSSRWLFMLFQLLDFKVTVSYH